ncbi:NAD(P)-binding protein [Aaosphaeria arxii CBS 175.79]|uniref:NAD(P)-binding protein n=1 Tax=Aaosphaeria arxii CBS 175.79 TaxID=1450172 RepID=A0A6A5Y6I4_9PLEO|nr:NAD(P)-binding protein [Aaosphaeria arxii CBS 175.79]KAF2021148.1 NAD(P)-binding protein [Aaosphaeria arxii CBS 175.79]
MSTSVTVLPGSGKQGQAAISELIERGYTVHTLVRNASSDISKHLQSLGATLHTGDLADVKSIEASLEHSESLFFAIPAHPVNEISFAENILAAARNKSVKNIIYSSVARTGDHESFPGWDADSYPLAWYWTNKQKIEDLVRTAGFPNWTILRPAFFVQNFCSPEVNYMFPGLADTQRLSIAYTPSTRLDLIDTKDIAKFAVAALDAPERFSGQEIPLAIEKLTADELAELLGAISGKQISVQYLSDDEAAKLVAQGHLTVTAQQWQRDVGYCVDLEKTRQYGITLTPVREALERDTLKW